MPGPLDEAEDLRRYAAYEDSTGDLHASELLGIGRTTFREWRNSRGLPAKPHRGRPLSVEQDQKRFDAYEATDSFSEASELVGITPSAFAQWARNRGLVTKTPVCVIPDEVHQLRRKAYEVTDTDRDAAYVSGCGESTFSAWRRMQGLPPKGFTPRKYIKTDEEEELLLKCWATMSSFQEIALFLGMEPDVVSKEIKKRGLGPLPRGQLPRDSMLDASTTKMWRALLEHTNDSESAKAVRMPAAAFARWRKRNQVPARPFPRRFWARIKQEAEAGNPVARYYYKDRYPRTHGLDA